MLLENLCQVPFKVPVVNENILDLLNVKTRHTKMAVSQLCFLKVGPRVQIPNLKPELYSFHNTKLYATLAT